MSNEIKSLLPMEPRRNGVVPGAAPSGKQAGSPERAAPEGPAQEKVTLTETARKLASLSAEAATGSVVDEAKVRQLRAAIEGGTYRPDPLAIADALIRFETAG